MANKSVETLRNAIQDRIRHPFRNASRKCAFRSRCRGQDGDLIVGKGNPLPAILRKKLGPVFGLCRLVCHGDRSAKSVFVCTWAQGDTWTVC